MARILLVSKPIVPPWNDGSKNLVKTLATHLLRHRATVLTRRGAQPDLPAVPGVPAVRAEALYRRAAGGFAPALRDNAAVFSRLLFGDRHDLWHFFFAPNPASSHAGRVAARARRVPCVQTVCSAPRPDADLKRLLFADRTVVLSRATEARVQAAGVDPRRVRRIAPAIDAAALPFIGDACSRRQRAREQLGFDLKRALVVYPGDLEFSRGAERTVRAHACLPPSLDAQLVLACRPKTPSAAAREQALRELTLELGTRDRVTFLGEVRAIHTLLQAADVVALPAEDLYAKLDYPLVLIEAMLLERAVLVLERTSAAELAEDDAAAVCAADESAVAQTLARLLEDAALRARMGRNARAAALTRHDPVAMARDYEALYDELLQE